VPLQVQTLMSYLEELAPRRLASDWDNVGLQVGSPAAVVETILVSLDMNEAVLHEAKGMGADLIITHHPFIFRPLSAVRTDLPQGRLIAAVLEAGMAVYSAHTNLDVAAGGVNDALAHRLGLQDTAVLRVGGSESLEKLAVFIPLGHEDAVRDALAAAGAGWIGNYSHCTFQTAGTGTFMPGEGTNPYLGRQGKLERAEEIRLETIYPATLRNRVVRAMIKAHPYEEVAYDLYPLLNEGRPHGLGRVGVLPQAMMLDDFCAYVKEKLEIPNLRITGSAAKPISKVAVCGGAGSDLLHTAVFAGAHVLVTGDVKYHDAQEADVLGLPLIDAGHDATERVIVPVLCDYLREKLAGGGHQAAVIASTVNTTPWRTL
jgi:dinuclear metal center YbgI/SA1388 family protein